MAMRSIGLIEANSYGAVVAALDAMLKAANVEMVKYDIVGGVWSAVFIAGDIGAVQAAVESGLAVAQQLGQARGSVVANPTPEYLELYDL